MLWEPKAAESILTSFFARGSRRYQHSAAVAAKARQEVGPLLPPWDREALVAAAWLHDLGHHPHLAGTGHHALDGARHLEGLISQRVVALVAHHSGARFEADLRGLAPDLNAFEDERSVVSDALTYCDMTTGPDGNSVTLRARVADIEARYGADHIVAEAMRAAWSELERAVRRVEQLLR